ncbi:hypothetical protein GCM10011611_21070 [Aliidongia dinghuensis]|uniref:DUF3800 domain-containing protein n=1 Tax=Aliidongia dinghuensis TaxID=1867774 RepID=A0A8J2YU11_9PROT|nr:DUF3800 domain-containing protein [Aliidongia dinghuensis]GGF15096.1 hypothetical protein GCM10011611_21070 [Aliidongia dinghuensis]
MTTALNKKVLCFVDEYGTAGAGDLYLGAVVVLARDAGRVDRCFTGLLEPNANEIHAADLDDLYLQGLLRRFWTEAPRDRIVLINQKIAPREGSGPIIYAQAVVETVKIGLKRFQRDVLGRDTIGNVEVITDQNHHNDHPDFRAEIERSRAHDGRFRAVNRLATIDSAASRLLQLADVVGYSRKWINRGTIRAKTLSELYGIQMP